MPGVQSEDQHVQPEPHLLETHLTEIPTQHRTVTMRKITISTYIFGWDDATSEDIIEGMYEDPMLLLDDATWIIEDAED